MVNVGTLNDETIIQMCKKRELITNCFEEKNVKQACYEIRASYEYYDLSDDSKYYNLKDSKYNYILLKPRQMVVILSLEEFNIPNNIIGRIMTKGKFFTIGLIPINTYADPGFKGKLGLVLQNLSTKYIKIFPEVEIAKIEFSKMEKVIKAPYYGQHGYNTNVWPIDTKHWLSESEISKDNRIKSYSEEVELSYGNHMSGVLELIEKYERKVLTLTIVLTIFSIVLIITLDHFSKDLGELKSSVIGIIPGVLIGLLIDRFTKFRRR